MLSDKVIERYLKNIQKIKDQRDKWNQFSLLGALVLFSLIIFWDWLVARHSDFLWIFVISTVGVIFITWWLWTLRLIRQVLRHQTTQFRLIFSIQEDLKDLKKELQRQHYNEDSES